VGNLAWPINLTRTSLDGFTKEIDIFLMKKGKEGYGEEVGRGIREQGEISHDLIE